MGLKKVSQQLWLLYVDNGDDTVRDCFYAGYHDSDGDDTGGSITHSRFVEQGRRNECSKTC